MEQLPIIAKKTSSAAPVPPSAAVVREERWKSDAENCLLEWIESPDNFNRYRSAAIPSKGRKRTQGCTKVGISQAISKYLEEKGFKKTDKQVRTKIENYIKLWKAAHKAQNSTGFGVDLSETNVKGK